MHPLILMDWQTPSELPSAQVVSWLFRPGSLTRHLKMLGRFEVNVLEEKHGLDVRVYPSRKGKKTLPRFSSSLFLRGSMLKVEGVAVVLAWTFVEEEACCTTWREIYHLGATPLGQILFHPEVKRGPFEWGCISASSLSEQIENTLENIGIIPADRLWARRSYFYKEGKPLVVSECFFPSFWPFVQQG